MKANVNRVWITRSIFVTTLFVSQAAHSQLVKHAWGLHLSAVPASAGFSYKAWLSPVFSIEGIAFVRPAAPASMQGLEASALFSRPVGRSRFLNAYVGGGLELCRNAETQVYDDRRTLRSEQIISWKTAIMSRAGMDYKLPHFPINVSADFGPGIQLKPQAKFRIDAHLAVRYTIPNTRYTAANYVNKTRVSKGNSFSID